MNKKNLLVELEKIGADSGFIAKATEKMKIYRTPKVIVDYIKRHEAIIGNPPFMGGDRRGKSEKN